MNQLSRIRLVVASGFAFSLLFEFTLDLGQTLQAILEAAKTIVDAPSRDEFLLSGSSKYLVDRWSRDSIKFCQATDFILASPL